MRINTLLKALVYSSEEMGRGKGAGFLINRSSLRTGQIRATEYELTTGRRIEGDLIFDYKYFHKSNPKIVPDTILTRVPDKSPLGRKLVRCPYPL